MACAKHLSGLKSTSKRAEQLRLLLQLSSRLLRPSHWSTFDTDNLASDRDSMGIANLTSEIDQVLVGITSAAISFPFLSLTRELRGLVYEHFLVLHHFAVRYYKDSFQYQSFTLPVRSWRKARDGITWINRQIRDR